ncbi:MAG TPA: STAS domain-containing protein [Terriglobales bacterium]
MIQSKAIIVREFPSLLEASESRRFFRQLRSDLSETYRPQVIFDLSRVQHMTAQGVDLLVRCIDQIADRDGELKFAAASPQTQLVLELTQISGVAETYESVEDAVGSWSPPEFTAAVESSLAPQAA